jgi:hypothetical protein
VRQISLDIDKYTSARNPKVRPLTDPERTAPSSNFFIFCEVVETCLSMPVMSQAVNLSCALQVKIVQIIVAMVGVALEDMMRRHTPRRARRWVKGVDWPVKVERLTRLHCPDGRLFYLRR